MERRSVRFVGQVQGVGFRMTARERASRFALTGWVRNDPDGSVAMEIQGDPGDLAAALDDIERHTAGRVDHRYEVQIRPVPHEQGFEIRF